MKFNSLLILILIFYGCSDSKNITSKFDNTVCLEFVQQSGYPMEICDCIHNKVSNIKNITEVTYENIEQLVNDCVQNKLGIY
tara:strand:- start:237 stop:482 length:246 start_codon:yes stop_codon:yes gene_type:complete